MRREERVTVQGPVKEQQPDGMSHRGLGGGGNECKKKFVYLKRASPVWLYIQIFIFTPQGNLLGLGGGWFGLGGGVLQINPPWTSTSQVLGSSP